MGVHKRKGGRPSFELYGDDGVQNYFNPCTVEKMVLTKDDETGDMEEITCEDCGWECPHCKGKPTAYSQFYKEKGVPKFNASKAIEHSLKCKELPQVCS